MSFSRIKAIFLRYFYFFKTLDNICELFYWPIVDIFLWGMTSVWIQKSDSAIPDVALIILTALVFWQITWRANYEITVNILKEFWTRNFVNLFSTPLRLREWLAGVMLVGLVKICIMLLFCSGFVWLLYTLNVFQIGFMIIPFVGLLTLSGWWMGLLSGSIMILYGQRMQMLAWMTPFLFAPFSAVFYPLETLPIWGQWIGKCLPTSYIFEGMRQILIQGTYSPFDFWMSLGLNMVYFGITFGAFSLMFEKSRVRGLSRLE